MTPTAKRKRGRSLASQGADEGRGPPHRRQRHGCRSCSARRIEGRVPQSCPTPWTQRKGPEGTGPRYQRKETSSSIGWWPKPSPGDYPALPTVRIRRDLLRSGRRGGSAPRLTSRRAPLTPRLTSVRPRLTPRLTPFCARLTPRQTSSLSAGLRSGSRWGRGRRRTRRLGLSCGYH